MKIETVFSCCSYWIFKDLLNALSVEVMGDKIHSPRFLK